MSSESVTGTLTGGGGFVVSAKQLVVIGVVLAVAVGASLGLFVFSGRGTVKRAAGNSGASEVFLEPDPAAAIDKLVSIFVVFWASDPVTLRRLRAMAVLDPEIAKGIQARDVRRAHIAGQILKRMVTAGRKKFTEQQLHAASTVLSLLTGFATYDALASAGHSQKETIAIIARLARCAVN